MYSYELDSNKYLFLDSHLVLWYLITRFFVETRFITAFIVENFLGSFLCQFGLLLKHSFASLVQKHVEVMGL